MQLMRPNDQLVFVRPNDGNFIANHTTVQQEIRKVQTRTCGYYLCRPIGVTVNVNVYDVLSRFSTDIIP